MGDHGVHAPAVGDGRGDGFQLVPTDVDFFQFLQFGHFTKKEEAHRAGSPEIIVRPIKKKILRNKSERGIYYDFKDSSKIHL